MEITCNNDIMTTQIRISIIITLTRMILPKLQLHGTVTSIRNLLGLLPLFTGLILLLPLGYGKLRFLLPLDLTSISPFTLYSNMLLFTFLLVSTLLTMGVKSFGTVCTTKWFVGIYIVADSSGGSIIVGCGGH